MAKIDVKDLTGAVTGSIELSDEIFGIEPNEVAMSTVVRNQLANRRQGVPLRVPSSFPMRFSALSPTKLQCLQ